MYIFIAVLSVLLFLLFCFIGAMTYCFFKVFYVRTKPDPNEEFPLPKGEAYEKYHDQLIKWIKASRSMSHKCVEITSHDGLKLRGKYYEYAPGAPIELMLHGYRGNSERDLSGGILRAFALGHSVLLVDLRGCGRSEGSISTFGIFETRDCLAWIEYIIDYIDFGAKIILTGVSMGASTVLIAAGRELPENVVGVLADCGFTSAKAEIKKVMKDMKLPSDLIYPFARLGGILFGGFDVDSVSSIESVKKARVPIIFLHGEGDEFVPCYMSRENYEACVSEKKLVTFPRAGHGLSYPADPERYLIEVREFFRPILGDQAPFDVEY